MREFVKRLYADPLKAKKEGKPVAYCGVMSAFDEILVTMDIAPVWWENYAGLCAAKNVADQYIRKAEKEGYSRFFCSYITNAIGFEISRQEAGGMPPNAPLGGMAEPDVVIGTGMMICDGRIKWHQALARYNEAPFHAYSLLWPPVDADIKEVEGYYIQHMVEQLRGLVDFLERQLHKKLDMDRLSEVVDIAEKTHQMWWEANQFRKASPCPMGSEDQFRVFVPAWFKKGTKEALEFYQGLCKELKYRAENKIGIVPEEKYRLVYGGGIPPWHSLEIFNYFKKYGAVFVAETWPGYRPSDIVEIPVAVNDPIERMAYRFFREWTFWHEKAARRSGDPIVEQILDNMEVFNARDGIFFHLNETCRTWGLGQRHQVYLTKQYVDVPTLIVEGDIVDSSFFSMEKTIEQIDIFMELCRKPNQGYLSN
ncbi:2-hydroxyacyl-CoA dehydratase subunit D [Thermodesulfobacteriota bacterium]